VNGAMDAVVFKDNDFSSSVYVTMQVNADSVLKCVETSALKQFYVRSRFFDEDWHTEHTSIDTVSVIDTAVIPGSRYKLYDLVQRSELPFGNYNLACAFEDNGLATVATFIGQCDGERLTGSKVRVSDLLYLRSLPGGVSIIRGDEVLPANPWKAYAPGQPLSVYFEIYNLDLSGGESRYELMFEIHEAPEDPPGPWNRLGSAVARFVGFDDGDPAVAQSFERVGRHHDNSERISIDVASLETGRYRLVVTVTDLRDGEKDRSSKIFYKTAGIENVR
jgi:hypothetical protein